MKWIKDRLYFADLALLWVIHEETKKSGKPPTKTRLFQPEANGLWNLWMADEGAFDSGYSRPITASNRISVSIKTLRELGFLDKDSFHYEVTKLGQFFLLWLNCDWHEWPVEIPIVDGQLDLDNAKYLE